MINNTMKKIFSLYLFPQNPAHEHGSNGPACPVATAS
jgi:hypothetical protein